MIDEVKVISEFVRDNKKSLAEYLRKKILAAGAKEYLDKLGKVGITEMENEAAGVLLDLGCAFASRLDPRVKMTTESIWPKLPMDLQKTVRLPRSDAYHEAMKRLK